MNARIIIGADVVPTKSNTGYFEKGDIDFLIGEELKEYLKKGDFIAMNLETPLTEDKNPIRKCGPNLMAGTKAIRGLQAINPYFLTLANNHILDQGEQGLCTTIATLEKAKIGYAGAGNNRVEASKPYIQDINGIRVGIYCCAEHEFSIASENSPGANPFDPLESPDHVSDLKKTCDYVIVLYHGGKEHYRYPSPNLQKVFRKLADKGADLVVAQHTHCIGCFEEYHGAALVYGQGNFLFDDSGNEGLETALLIQLDLDKADEKISSAISYIPLRKTKETVRMAAGDDRKKILSEFVKRSNEIKVPGTVEKKYSAFAERMLGTYLIGLSGNRRNFFLRAVNKLSGNRFFKWYELKKYTKRDRLVCRNYIECECHRELLLYGLKME